MGEGWHPSRVWKIGFGLAAATVLAAAAAAHAEPTAPMVQQAALVIPGVAEEAAPAEVEPPGPKIVARIDVSDQTMSIYVDDLLVHVFKVSTARKGYITPVGRYAPEWLSRFHRSKKYHNSPMPWSVFFHGGYAVHGTTEVRRLGRPASHGCVRLHPDNAKIFYQLVQASGKTNSRVAIVQ